MTYIEKLKALEAFYMDMVEIIAKHYKLFAESDDLYHHFAELIIPELHKVRDMILIYDVDPTEPPDQPLK